MNTKKIEKFKRHPSEDSPKRYTLKEYQQMIENGRHQIENGECLSTDEVMQMCMEDKDLTAPVDSRRNRRKVSRREEVEFSTSLF